MSKRAYNQGRMSNRSNFDHQTSNRRNQKEMREVQKRKLEAVEKNFGYSYFAEDEKRTGWLLNTQETRIGPTDEINALAMYFVDKAGEMFKCHSIFRPYFYVFIKEPSTKYRLELINILNKKFGENIHTIEAVEKLDLDMPNHWDRTRGCLKLVFDNTSKMLHIRRELQHIVNANKKRKKVKDVYSFAKSKGHLEYDEEDNYDVLEALQDIREFDYPYVTRAGIDLNVFVGSWYEVLPAQSSEGKELGCALCNKLDMVEKPSLKILAFDIECCKRPLKFPDPHLDSDEVFMISYMVNGTGYLIINRAIVSKDIENFEHAPKEEYKANFIVTNVKNEHELLVEFYRHCKELKPNVFSTYNGDCFDFWYLDVRSKCFNINMEEEIGFRNVKLKSGSDKGFHANREYISPCSAHIDCLYWVKRDSYLPAGSRSLKKVTAAKLGFDPVEIEPEKMVEAAQNNPIEMATYSVSDALITYFLFDKYINNFIFSLCTIIPMQADQVLRKGSGTLCEMLLMTEAFRNNIIAPNKVSTNHEKFDSLGRYIEKETYVGGHVECLESGVFRSDLLYDFKPNSDVIEKLIEGVGRDLTFKIEVECSLKKEDVVNFEEVRDEIVSALIDMNQDRLHEKAKIYHLDVSAMYPNIILTNRLQPSSIVSSTTCTGCDYRDDVEICQRKMDWTWRGDVLPCTKGEFMMVKTQLEHEQLSSGNSSKRWSHFQDGLTKRLKKFCETQYGKRKDTVITKKEGIVCQREHGFYVDTVKNFRDRRYQYKRLTKQFSKEKKALANSGASKDDIATAGDKVVLYDSLQLAHKCILNSFYGYVMRKGSRWFSMEMAAMVTHTGANIIKQAKQLIEGVGRVLELDTDGVWCILPESFPEDYTLKLGSGKEISVSYPCMMLNCLTHELFTNHQYQTLKQTEDGNPYYETHSECSIYFEVDGPYRCMVIPASQEEDKLLKKRYAVFNFDGSLAELKGFELKRRGELSIVKNFQKQCFPHFLNGNTLQECYESVAEVANRWLDILVTRGEGYSDEEVIELLAENRSMSKALSEYGDRKSNSITTAKRLADFLGEDMVSNAGLSCKLLIAKEPSHAPTSERAIPCAIFSAEPAVREDFLFKWTGSHEFELKEILDWDYYLERLGATAMKIISIPAMLQGQKNPVKHITLPKWARRQNVKSKKITTFFQKRTEPVQIRKRVTANASNTVEKASQEILPDASSYSYRDDFKAWIADRKKRWRTGKNALKKMKYGTSENLSLAAKLKMKQALNSRNLDSFVQGGNKPVEKDKSWQITDIHEVSKATYKLKLSTDKDYRDIYITGFTSISEVINKLGCVIALRIDNLKRTGTIQSPYKIDDLKRLSTVTNPYLASDNNMIYLYHTHAYDTHFVAIFIPSGLNENFLTIKEQKLWEHAKVMIYSTAKKGVLKNSTKPNDILDNLLDSAGAKSSDSPSPEIELVTTKGGFKNIANLLSEAKAEASRKLMKKPLIVVETTLKEHEVFQKTIQNTHTVIFVNNQEPIQRSLQFESIAMQKAVIGYIRHHSSAERVLEKARYGHIPVACLSGDIPEKMFSCFFARMMQHNRIQYITNPAAETKATVDKLFNKKQAENDKEVFSRNSDDPEVYQEIFAFVSSQEDIKFERQGVYRGYCLEITIGCLVVNAILKAEQILAFEKSRLQEYAANFENCARKFAVLRTIVQNLVHDVTKSGSELADMLLNNIYRLVTDKHAEFYDIELAQMVEELLKKLFYQLLAEVSECGAEVICGTQQRLVISTKAKSLNEAEAFFLNLKTHIKSLDMFKVLYFEVTKHWKSMIYINEFNLISVEPNEETQELEVNIEMDSIMHMSEESIELVEYAMELFLVHPLKDKNGDKSKIVASLIEDKIQSVVLDFVNESKRFKKRISNDWIEVQQIVLVLCYLMELDRSVTNKVNILRRCAFRLFETSEFTDIVQIDDTYFVNNFDVKLKHVTCQVCFFCTDYNLTHLARSSEKSQVYCKAHCGSRIPLTDIEFQLAENIKIELKRKMLGDLVCKVCRAVKDNTLSNVCNTCSGELVETPEMLRLWGSDKVLPRAYKEVAMKFDLKYLLDIAKYYEEYYCSAAQ